MSVQVLDVPSFGIPLPYILELPIWSRAGSTKGIVLCCRWRSSPWQNENGHFCGPLDVRRAPLSLMAGDHCLFRL